MWNIGIKENHSAAKNECTAQVFKIIPNTVPQLSQNTQATSLSAVFIFFKSCQFITISYDTSDI